MYLDKTDFIVSDAIRRGSYEPFETDFISSLIKEGDVVVDAGANIGYYTLLLAKLVGNTGKVYSFEPNPSSFNILRKNIKKNGINNVQSFDVALCDNNGHGKLYINDYNKGDNRIYRIDDKQDGITIKNASLDQIIPPHEHVDFIKMDTQGAEVLILKGMKRILKNYRPMMIIEYWPIGLKRARTGAKELLEILTANGYQYQMIDENTGKLIEITAQELFDLFPETKGEFTNLFCSHQIAR